MQIMYILRILCHNVSLVTWTVVSLTVAKFKVLIFSVSEFSTFKQRIYTYSNHKALTFNTFHALTCYFLNIKNYWVFGLCPSSGILKDCVLLTLRSTYLFIYRKLRLNGDVDLDDKRTCPCAGCEMYAMFLDCPLSTAQLVHQTFVQTVRTLDTQDYPISRTQDAWQRRDTQISCNQAPISSNVVPSVNTPTENYEARSLMKCRCWERAFCWHCLASLDAEALLRHFYRTPCKNKLAYSGPKLISYRTLMITLVTVLGILLLVTPPLLLTELCIVWCSRRVAHRRRLGDGEVWVQFCMGGCEAKTLCVIFGVCNSVRLL
jgi:hypothetical protein